VTAVPQGGYALPGTILLAEDNQLSRRVAEVLLESLGFRVDVVSDGAEAVKTATRNKTGYRAILMDCQIPVLDGFEATAEIRRLEGPRRRTPIIAVTASADPHNQERCLAAGMDEVVVKPLTSASLAALLTNWVPDGSVPSIAIDPAEHPSSNRMPTTYVAETTRPALDPQTIARLDRLGVEAGEDLVLQLAKLFAADADTRVIALRHALATEDAAVVLREAHTLSGASVNIGATRLSQLCDTLAADIAKDIGTRDLQHGWALLDLVEAELVRVHSALRTLQVTA
jgi:CheY-like chemotaxis protein/HPt (histidine-containing phosphotransfer) domain-containing protein